MIHERMPEMSSFFLYGLCWGTWSIWQIFISTALLFLLALFPYSWVTELFSLFSLSGTHPILCRQSSNCHKYRLGLFAPVISGLNSHVWLSESFPWPCHPLIQNHVPSHCLLLPPIAKSSLWATGLLSWAGHPFFPLPVVVRFGYTM